MSAAAPARSAAASVNEAFDRHLFNSFWSLAPQTEGIVMPWESGPVALILGSVPSLPSCFMQSVPPPIPIPPKPAAPVSLIRSAAFSRRVLRIRRLELVADTVMRHRAVSRWMSIIKLTSDGSELGRTMLADEATMHSDETMIRSVEDVLSSKSTRTLMKRSGDLIKYIQWCDKSGLPAFPVVEKTLYACLCSMRDAGAAPTACFALKSAINFAGGLVGVDGALSSAASKRVIGVAYSEYLKKAPLRQMKPCTVGMIKFAESVLHNLDDAFSRVDQVFSGVWLLCVYLRLRFSDAQRIRRIVLDLAADGQGYVETEQAPGKTANTKEKKTTLLLAAGPVGGLMTSGPWAVKYLQLLTEEGLISESGHVINETLLTVPGVSGCWTAKKVCSTEASAWFRELLIRGGFTEAEANERATHSWKTTGLSWAAKYGVSRSSRKYLGYHVDSQDQSMALYSRDLAAKALRDFDGVLRAIIDNTFVPDASRSGYFVSISARGDSQALFQPVAKRRVMKEPVPVISSAVEASPAEIVDTGVASDQDSTDSSSSSSNGESACLSDDESLAVAVGADVKPVSRFADDGVYQHVRYGTLHLLHSEIEGKLACSRLIGPQYRVFAGSAVDWSKCNTCFGSGQFSFE